MHFAAVQTVQLVKSGLGIFICCGTDGQSNQHFIGVQSRVAAAQVAYLKSLNGFDYRRGDELHFIGDARERLQCIEQSCCAAAQQGAGFAGNYAAVG